MDGELEAHEITSTFDALRHDRSLRADWCSFHRVREALRSESAGAIDITERVLAALESEPTVLVPVVARRAAWLQPAMALAASFAGIAVVGWVGLGGNDGASVAQFVRPRDVVSPTSTASIAQVKVAAVKAQSRSLHEYVLAHQAHASAKAFAGNTRYVRTVTGVSESH